MSGETSRIYLLEVASDLSVEAELRDAISQQQLQDWRRYWQPAVQEILEDLNARGVPTTLWPQSRHWDWPRKVADVEGLLAARGFSVVAVGTTQGLAQVDLTRSAKEASQKGRPLVYVDYLEVAPWNQPFPGRVPKFRGVGTALLSAAIQLSLDEGFKGRIGLHSLPQANNFYLRHGMTDLGQDPNYQGLKYFEMTPAQAEVFLK